MPNWISVPWWRQWRWLLLLMVSGSWWKDDFPPTWNSFFIFFKVFKNYFCSPTWNSTLLSFAVPMRLFCQLWFYFFLICFWTVLISSFSLWASETIYTRHGTFNSTLSLTVSYWCQLCLPASSLSGLQGVASLLHFLPWRVLDQQPQSSSQSGWCS